MATSKISMDKIYTKNYRATVNGVVWDLCISADLTIGVLSIYTGSLTNAVPSNTQLINLSAFSSDFDNKFFAITTQASYTTRVSARFSADINTRKVTAVDALDAKFSPRGSILVMLKDA